MEHDEIRYAGVGSNYRYALVKSPAKAVEPYLPANYVVVMASDEACLIAGADHAGWTLDDYVLPRLASGLHMGVEMRL